MLRRLVLLCWEAAGFILLFEPTAPLNPGLLWTTKKIESTKTTQTGYLQSAFRRVFSLRCGVWYLFRDDAAAALVECVKFKTSRRQLCSKF